MLLESYEDFLERRKPPTKLVEIGKILKKFECHKEEESEDFIEYTVLFNNNSEAYDTIKKLNSLGCHCHNESREWEDYDGQDTMWSVSWTRKTIYG